MRTSSSLHSSAGTLRRILQAVGTVASSPLFSLPFSQGLEMCGPHRRFAPLLPRTLRRIPQAVGTVATTTTSTQITVVYIGGFNTASDRYYYFITFVFSSLRSGTRDVRASSSLRSSAASHPSSHTASGRYCCSRWYHNVSIPQAVGAVATGLAGHWLDVTYQ